MKNLVSWNLDNAPGAVVLSPAAPKAVSSERSEAAYAGLDRPPSSPPLEEAGGEYLNPSPSPSAASGLFKHPSMHSSKFCQSICGLPSRPNPITSFHLAGPTSVPLVYVVVLQSSAPYTGSIAVKVRCTSHGSSSSSESLSYSDSVSVCDPEGSPPSLAPSSSFAFDLMRLGVVISLMVLPDLGHTVVLESLKTAQSGDDGSMGHAMVCTPLTVAGCITSTTSFFMNPSPSLVTCLDNRVTRITGLYSVWQRRLPTRIMNVGTPSLRLMIDRVVHTMSFCGDWNFDTTAENTNALTTTPTSMEKNATRYPPSVLGMTVPNDIIRMCDAANLNARSALGTSESSPHSSWVLMRSRGREMRNISMMANPYTTIAKAPVNHHGFSRTKKYTYPDEKMTFLDPFVAGFLLVARCVASSRRAA